MKNYYRINNLVGWVIFAIASSVYIKTVEPTASFWDCGEFISCAFKLEVSHPPGYPMFAMLGHLATLFAGGNVSRAPLMVNIFSAICSAFTILFLFWTITHLARKIVGKKEKYSNNEIISIIGSGIIGALTFTFSDSHWFSAVEAVVFSPSSALIAFIFWAILKWEEVADEKYANRWLVLIAYVMGLSIGMHLLNLLTIPALGLVYYFRKYPVTRKGIIITVLTSFFILGLIMYGIIQGTFVVASWFELLFVNGFGLPFNSGWIFFVVVLFLSLSWGIWYTLKKKKVLWNTILLCLTVILLGYSSYTMSILRADANTPLNEGNPSNLFNLLSYLSREQYGNRPLLYGPYYNAPVRGTKEGKPVYAQKDGKYEIVYYQPEYDFDPEFCTFFPRMFSTEGNHVEAYKDWANIKGTPIQTTNQQGEATTVYKPTFGENLKFFFRYQVEWMYFRYFMWNFSGRQNDVQGFGDVLRGNWITGIKFIDELRLGKQDNLPNSISGYKFKNNKARNKYYMLPLLLGLVGMYFHFNKHKRNFSVILLLFFMTGLAIILYLNQTPYQPRERDYSYASSFYAFSIWVGLGAMALINWLSKRNQSAVKAVVIILICLIAVPVNMARENWDDHNRSNRFTSTDFAYDYLNSCAPHAILFTNGDNDTFPLWCAQEVLGVRTDVRVVNLSYLTADWYIEQMQRKVYDSDPVPFSMTKDKYEAGKRDVVYIVPSIKDYTPIKEVIDFVASDNPATKTLSGVSERVDYLPTRMLSLKVDTAKVLANGTVSPAFAKSVVPVMKWDLGKRNVIYKSNLMILDLIANNNWNRPVYFVFPSSEDTYLGLSKYARLDGFACRIVPVEGKVNTHEFGSIDSKILYDNLMNKFKWGNISDLSVYVDENNIRMISNFRTCFSQLAEQLINENKVDSAIRVLDKCLKVIPAEQAPLNLWALPLVEQYYRAKQLTKANYLAQNLFDNLSMELNYFSKLGKDISKNLDNDKRMSLYTLSQLEKITRAFGQKELNAKIVNILQNYMQMVE